MGTEPFAEGSKIARIEILMEPIKMVDLRSQYLKIKNEVDNAINQVLSTTAFINGPQVSTFAAHLGAYLDARFVIPCGNGTDALQIALMALDPQPGDEVILAVHSYVAAAEVVALLKLVPVFVDVDERTFNIDINQIEDKISRRTKAIIPVHLYGQCADMEPILSIAEKYGLAVIEDAAQALGADYRFSDGSHAKAGTIGLIGTTSFFPSKTLGCYGDGGAIFTDDSTVAEKMSMIANHGQRSKYYHEIVGMNSRLDTIQAAILSVKLQHLDDYRKRRLAVADFYDKKLLKSILQTPFRSVNSTHVFHQYTCKLQIGKRDEFQAYLLAKGIPTMVYYPMPLHFQKPFLAEKSFPVAERLSESVISLPIHTEMDEIQLEHICDTINAWVNGKG